MKDRKLIKWGIIRVITPRHIPFTIGWISISSTEVELALKYEAHATSVE